ncbi:MAG TPA: hypothetical protein VEY08_07040, partial [Chloroflexia bacterium]|nr:hypothetical protein [Chloroflexia bacterium]
MDNSNQPGSTPERPAGETPPNPEGTPSTGQPTERVTPYGAESTPAVDPSQLTMPQPQTTIYTPQPNVPGPGPASQPQQPYTGEAARAPQQPPGQYQQPGPQQGYPQQPYAQRQFPQGKSPQGQNPPQGQYQQP